MDSEFKCGECLSTYKILGLDAEEIEFCPVCGENLSDRDDTYEFSADEDDEGDV